MNLIYFFIGLVVLAIVWAVPALVIAFLIKRLTKKKLSKGWCVLIAALSACFSMGIEVVLFGTGKPGLQPGLFDLCVRFACLSPIFTILYDKNIPSILDSEKELKEKLVKLKSEESE